MVVDMASNTFSIESEAFKVGKTFRDGRTERSVTQDFMGRVYWLSWEHQIVIRTRAPRST